MKITELETSKVLPYWNNPRKNEETVERLIKSIQDYGFNTPIVVNHDMVVVNGHARLKAAKRLGMKTVPCVVVNLTDEQAKKYRIADNKIADLSEWEDDALFKELREIANPYDLLDMGFSSSEITSIVGDVDSLIDEALEDYEEEEDFLEVSGASVVASSTIAPQPKENASEAPQNAVQPMIQGGKTKEELKAEIEKREKELNTRFQHENVEQKKYDNIVICPHCGEKFKVRGLK